MVTAGAVVVVDVEVVTPLELVEPPSPLNGVPASALVAGASAASATTTTANPRITGKRRLIAPNISGGGP